MEYVLLDIYWNRIFCGKEIDFNIRQLAAIHVDDDLHTVSTFHRLDSKDSKMAKQITYMLDINDDVIMEFESAWEEFKQWLPDNVVFIVWDSEIKHIIQRCNKMFRKNPIRAQFVDLQMLQEAMFPIRSNKKSLGGVMTALGLTCEQSHMLSVLYCAQCILRLYRKLWKEGRKFFEQHEWKNLLQNGDFKDLQKMDFFPERISKSMKMECLSRIKDFCKEKQFELHTKGPQYEISTNYAVWHFNLINRGDDLIYIPKKYAQIPHYDMQIEAQSQNEMVILSEIFNRINLTEERLKFGVGCAEVEAVLEKLCNVRLQGSGDSLTAKVQS